MTKRRVYYEKEETKITKERGWMDIDMDYTQLYHCFTRISPKINSATTFKLLFWLLANKTNDSNGIDTSTESFNQFNSYLSEVNKVDTSITYRTFMNCMTELKTSGALTQVGRGHYYANPNMFWQDSTKKRTILLSEEAKDGNYISVNPTKMIEI